MNLQESVEIVKRLVKKTEKKTVPVFGRVLDVHVKKSATDIYSEVDLLADEIIYSTLSLKFPDFNYLSEERKFIDKSSIYTWVVDPLDGSIAFISGLEYWGISIGLLKDKKPVLGVINIPSKGWLFSAIKGEGAFLNNKRVVVSKQRKYDKAIIGFDVGHRGDRKKDLLKSVVPQIDEVLYMPSFACATFGQVLVAKGVYDAYIHHRAFIWDICAGAIIVKEAGGRVTDHQGRPLDWRKKGNLFMLASNGILHERILQILN